MPGSAAILRTRSPSRRASAPSPRRRAAPPRASRSDRRPHRRRSHTVAPCRGTPPSWSVGPRRRRVQALEVGRRGEHRRAVHLVEGEEVPVAAVRPARSGGRSGSPARRRAPSGARDCTNARSAPRPSASKSFQMARMPRHAPRSSRLAPPSLPSRPAATRPRGCARSRAGRS